MNSINLQHLSFFLFSFLLGSGVYAMPGGGGCTAITGDACSNPLTLNVGGCVNNNTSNATCGADFTAASYPCGASQDDMFFEFTLNQTRCYEMNFDMTSGMGGDLNMMLIDGACSSLLMSQCGTGGSVNMIYTGDMAAGTYVVCVSGASSEGAFSLCADIANAGAPPANDDCVNTQSLNTEEEYSSTNKCATTNCDYAACTQTNEDCNFVAQGPNCNGGNMATCWGSVENSVWYEFTPTTTGNHFVQLYNQNCNTADGVQFAVFTTLNCTDAALTAASEMACTNNQTTGDIFEEIIFNQGQTYYIAVDGFAGATCDYNLFIGAPQFMPVVWSDMQLTKKNDDVRLHWKTSSEKNNEKFVIEWARSIHIDFNDDESGRKMWEVTGEIPGANTTSREQSYSFVHKNPLPGYNFYRVRQIDLDGSESTSKIMSVYWSAEEGNYLEMHHQLSPNPFDDIITLSYLGAKEDEVLEFTVLDIKGQVVATYTLNCEAYQPFSQELQVADLASGIYLYELRNKGDVVKGKILKK